MLFAGLIDLPWWGYVLVALGLTHITIAAVTIFLHRCQAHRALELHPVVSHFFRLWLWLTTGMVTKEWAAIHRKHHAKCETEDDPHSPQIHGINKVLWTGVFLYVKEAFNKETIERYGHGTPDDWMERNVYSSHSILGLFLTGAINVALFHPPILGARPAAVVSGMNHGLNLGSDVYYSGTVAAAREGALRGIPSVAFSLETGGDRDAACALAVKMVETLLGATLPEGSTPLLNVNFPKVAPRGVRATRIGRRLYADDVVVRQDPRGRDYFWIGGPATGRHEQVAGSDTEAIDDGFVSVTPLALEATSTSHFGLAAFVAALGSGEGTT